MKQKTLDMIKRLTSLLLVFATCLGILPQFVSPAYAAGKEWRYIWLISQPSPLLCISSDNGTKQIKEVYIANMTTEADRAAGAPKRFLKCKEKTIDGEVYWVVDNDYATSSNADSPMVDLVDQGAIDPLNAVQASDSTAYPDVGYVRLVSNFTNSTATDIKGWEDASFEYVPNSQKPFDPDTITEQNQDTTFWAGNKQGNEFATVTPGPDEWVNHIVSRVGRSDENQEYPGGYYPSFLNIRDLPRFDEPDTVYYAQIALRASDVAALVHEKDLAGEWEDGVCYINAPNNAQFQFKSVRELPDPERGNLIIRKIDSLTGKALANVSFKIEQVDGGYTSSIQTGGNGEATLDGGDLKTGSYIVTEINSATGHVLNTAPQTFAWVEGQKKDIALTFTNDPKGGVDIYKYDEDTNAALEGAAFDVYKDGKKISSLITNESGHATINNLSEGHYQVIEVNPPAGYLKDTKPYEVYIDPSDTNGEIVRKLNIPNHIKSSLRILKVDAGSRTPLAGFQFDVTKDSQPYTSGTTDENGEIVLTNLEPGTYRVHEAGGSEEYIIDAPDQEIEITGTETEVKTLTFENTKKVGYWLLKLDEETGAPIPHAVFSLTRNGQEVGRYETDGTGYVKLENVEPGTYVAKEESVPSQYIKSDETFLVEIDKNSTGPVVYTVTNVQKKDLVLRKIDKDTGEPMQGVAFKIFKDNLEIGCQETDAEGLITLPYADPGSYRFEEYRTLAGYELNTTPITVEQTSERTMTVTTSNVIRKKLTITKVDEKTKKPLEGVTFEIFKDNESLGHYTTDKNGQIIIEHAPPGSYRAVEIDTLAEYIMNTESKTIEHTLDKDSEMLFTNIHRPGLWIKKLDGITGNPLKGAKFQIWASPEKSEGSMQDLGTFFTNENGEIVLSTESGKYLKEGWYRVKEVQAPTGYIISGNDTQEVFLSNGDYATLTFQDQPLSALVIWKNDSRTGRGVEGATFQVRYLEGNSGTGGNVVATVKTGTNGSVSVTDLKPGTYIVEEIAAPNGYIIDTAPQTVFISGDEQKVVEVSFSDSPYGDLLIKKMDSVTKQPLQGVVFKVKTADGTVVGNSNGEFATNEDGAILVNGIEPHTTLVVNEISTIPGYVLDTTPKTVETIPGETVTVTFTDQPKSTLIVEKYDEVTGDPLQGVEFKIIPSDGKLLTDNEGLTSGTGLYTTDHNGQITLTNLTPGSYIVTETKPLDGYSMTDGAAQTVVLSAGQTYRVRFYNTPDGNLMIKKIDSVTGAPLAGVEFKIECLDNGEFRSVTKTTDQSGVISLSRIPTGTYKVTETRALDGYELDDVAQTAFVEPGKTAELTFRNRPLGGLLIKKKDSVTGEPISGVTFKVSHSSGAVVGTGNGEFTTDAGGFISIPDLDAGTYIVQEIRAKEGYVLDNSVKTIEVKDHQTYTLEFYNQPYGKIIVNKIDSETKKPLKGVEFEIRNSAGELVGDHPVAEGVTTGSSSTGQISSNGKMTTDSQGHITLNSVKPDTYTITEIATIPGYILDSTPRSVIVGPGDTQTITIGNSPKGFLQIRKIDSATKEPLEGVKFKITNSNGDNVADNEGATSSNGIFTTDENGEINIGKLEPDTYTVTEIETVDGYVKDAQPQTVRVNSNDKQVLTFTNPPKGSLIVRKIDSVTKEPLTGVKFKIIMSNGELITGNGGASGSNGIYTTDNNGEIVLTKLKPGTYSVTETETIEGYEMDAQPQSVLISNNSAQTLTFTNTPRGGLIIKKMDSITKEPLSGVTFKVTTTDGTIVGVGNGEYTTDSEGFIRISKMPPTTYVVQEIRAKTGYVLDNTPKTINIKDHQTYTLDVYNQPYGGLIIHKTDSATKKPLAGVEFRITTADGHLVPDNDGLTSSNGRYVTDATGEIKLSNVKPGAYVVAETRTIDGYVIDAEPQTVVVDPADVQTLNFTNAPKGSLTVRKIDSVTKEPLAGVQFKIVTSNGELITGNGGATSANGVYTTDNSGEIVLTKLQPGTYAVAEVATIDGYEMDAEPQTALVSANTAQTLTFTNTPRGGLIIKKMDSVSREPISGVTFKVTTEDGAIVGTANGEYTTDSSGLIHLTKLAPATYIVQEVRAKTGYVLDNTPKTIRIADHQTYTLEVYNQPYGGLIIHKTDGVSKKPLQGVEFKITTADGQLVPDNDGLTSSNGRYVTDAEGEIKLSNVKPGTYIVTETKTLDGYVIDAEPQTVVVNPADIQTLNFTNAPKSSLSVRIIDKVTKEPLPGAKVKIVNTKGELVQGAAGTTSSNGIYTADENGEISLSNVPPDTYIVTQTETIDGYVMDSQPETVVIGSGDAKTVTLTNTPKGGLVIKKMDAVTKAPISDVLFKVTTQAGVPVGTSSGEYRTDANGFIQLTKLDPGFYAVKEVEAKSGYVLDDTPKTIEVKDHQTYTLEVFNRPKGGLVIRKVDTQTREPLAGVQFEVRTAAGTLVSSDEGLTSTNGIFTTDEKGEISIEKLTPGTYAVTEIKTVEGYMMDGQPQTVVIGENDTQVLTFTNTRMGSLVVTKIDSATRKPLQGVTFRVQGEDEYGFAPATYTTDVNGQFRIDEIPSGVYTVQEMTTIDGYKLDDTAQTVKIESGKQKNLTFTNDPLGGLLVKKMDSITKEPLSEVAFKITTPSGVPVGTSNEEFVTDSRSYISVTDIEPGTYIVEEVQAKSGYVGFAPEEQGQNREQ